MITKANPMILNLTLQCAMGLTITSSTRINNRIFIVFYEDEEKKKIPIEDMYYEILFFLNEPEYDSPKRGKMTMGTRYETRNETRNETIK